MGYAPMAARILAVICWFTAGCQIHGAIALWRERYKSDVHGEVSDLHHFIKRNATKFLRDS
jgi:hypothetical protein